MTESVGFPLRDPVGPAGPAIAPPGAAVVADLVAPGAARADAQGVRRETLDALAAAGLLGTPLAPDAQRETAELLAGSDASTWFCWVQHFTPLRILESATPSSMAPDVDRVRDRLLPGLRTGRLLAAVAFAHVRRPGAPNPVATRVPGGWRLDGTLDWVTSWDIADVVMVLAQGAGEDAGSLVCAYLPAGGAQHPSAPLPAGLTVGPPLTLLAMGGTHTRPVRLDGVLVSGDELGAVLDLDAWRAEDARRSVDANPSAFGVARGALAELDLLADERSDEVLAALVSSLADEVREVRSVAYAAADGGADTAERLALRARSLDLCARAATAVVIARAGASILAEAPSGRRLREAMFLQVQAQTAATRRASLELMRRGSTSS